MAAAVRAERPPRLRHRQRRVLLRDLLPRRAAAGRPAGRAALGPRRLPQPGGLHQPVQAQQRAGPALGLRRRRRRAAQGLPALPHLPRQRDEPGGAARQHRGLERRGARGGQPRAVPRQVRAGHAAAGRRAGRARCPTPASTSGPACPAGGDDVAFAPRPARSIQCDRAAGQPAGARSAHGRNPGAGRVRMALVAAVAECLEAAQRIVSYTQSSLRDDAHDPQLQNRHRPRLGRPRRDLAPSTRPKCATPSST